MVNLNTKNQADVAQLLQAIRKNVDRIGDIINPAEENGEDDLDPANPLNKIGVNLSDRGVEVCYRLFDAGKSRYAVASELRISYGAATHRFHAWEKLGGKNRQKNPLN
jgi:hypothetical protein